MKKKYIWIIVGVISASLITVLGISIPILMIPPSKEPEPDEWLSVNPEEVGMNSSKFEDMYDYIQENSTNLHSVLIIRNGYIVDESFLQNYVRREENYFAPNWMVPPETNYTMHQVWSCTKSVISLLIGIAIEKEYIDNISQTIYEFLEDYWKPSYDERKKNITIRHLLTHTSGLPGFGIPSLETYTEWVKYQSFIQGSLDKSLLHDPGDYWYYGDTNAHLLSAIINITTGQKTSEFAREHLFERIGISQEDWNWGEDYQGISDGAGGLIFTPRAMAKIGILTLNNGSWNGTQVVPEEWIYESTTPYSDDWVGYGGLWEESSDYWDGYGYLWWLTDDYYSALGIRGQCITVIPEYDIIVIITADISGDFDRNYKFIINSFIIGGIISKEPISEDYWPTDE